MEMPRDILEIARAYRAAGLSVIASNHVIGHTAAGKPICSCGLAEHCASPGKHPAGSWSARQIVAASDADLVAWFGGDEPRHRAVGIVTGAVSGNVFVVDVDCGPGKEGDDSLRALQMRHEDLPPTAEVRTGGGGRHLFFRAPVGVRVRSDKNVLGPGVDIRGEGGFVVAPPSVHASGHAYRWDPFDHLGSVGIADAPGWLLKAVRDGAARPVDASRGAGGTQTAPAYQTAPTGSLGILPPRLVDGREAYMVSTILACLRQLIGETGAVPTPQELYDVAWPQYDAKVDWRCRPGRGPAEFMAKVVSTLRRFERGQIRGLRSMEEAVETHRAKRAAAVHAYSSAQHFSSAHQGDKGHKGQQASGSAHGAQTGQDGTSGDKSRSVPPSDDLAKPVILRDPRLIPRRQWLYGDSYVRSFLSVIASTGGAGKTTLYVAEALAIASGRPLLGIKPAEPAGVWMLNLEDPADEMERRIAAAAIHHGITQDEIEGRLFCDAGRQQPLVIAAQSREGVTIYQPVVDAVVAQIRAKKIAVLIVDPFVASHSVNENDNQAINAVLALWRLIADLTGCCIVLVHHVRKPNGEEMTIDSVRGGSAIVGAVRTARVLNPMSEAEAAKLGIDPAQRRRYVRVDNAKNNLSPPADKATWFELASVDLGNGLHGGDRVGVASAWSPPDQWEGVTVEHLRAAHRYLSEHGPQPASPQSKEWFGHRVAEILDLPESAGARVRTVLDGWVKARVIGKDRQYDRSKGREMPVFVAGTPPL